MTVGTAIVASIGIICATVVIVMAFGLYLTIKRDNRNKK